jgi:hypothetical protein
VLCCLSLCRPPKISSYHRHVPGLVDTSSYLDFNHTPSTPAPRRHPTPIHNTAHITRIPFHPLPQYCLALLSPSRATHANPLPPIHPSTHPPPFNGQISSWLARTLSETTSPGTRQIFTKRDAHACPPPAQSYPGTSLLVCDCPPVQLCSLPRARAAAAAVKLVSAETCPR